MCDFTSFVQIRFEPSVSRSFFLRPFFDQNVEFYEYQTVNVAVYIFEMVT